ncbi:hypothetical protein U1Q18_026646 [Sarracenia purpurea var. burkii]
MGRQAKDKEEGIAMENRRSDGGGGTAMSTAGEEEGYDEVVGTLHQCWWRLSVGVMVVDGRQLGFSHEVEFLVAKVSKDEVEFLVAKVSKDGL